MPTVPARHATRAGTLRLMNQRSWRTPLVVLVCGCVIMAISFGIRAGFGLFLQPMSLEYGWGREVLSFSLALQNLMWGALGAVGGETAPIWLHTTMMRPIWIGSMPYCLLSWTATGANTSSIASESTNVPSRIMTAAKMSRTITALNMNIVTGR